MTRGEVVKVGEIGHVRGSSGGGEEGVKVEGGIKRKGE